MEQLHSLMLAGCAGALATFFLQKYGCSAVVASCLVGLAGALLGHYIGFPNLPLVIFAGSFVGMTSLTQGTIPNIIFAGLLTGLLYKLSTNIFTGFGGRLGTIAFISTVATIYLFQLLRRLF